MATIKKPARKKAEDGGDYKKRQGNYPSESQSGKGPSSDYKERQGQSRTSTPPNSFEKATPPASKATSASSEETFGQAFKRNRAAGAKTFTWKGKSYTTETAEDVAKKAAPKPYSTSAAAAKASTASSSSTKSSSVYTPDKKSYSGNPREGFGPSIKKPTVLPEVTVTTKRLKQNTTGRPPGAKGLPPAKRGATVKKGCMSCGGKMKKK